MDLFNMITYKYFTKITLSTTNFLIALTYDIALRTLGKHKTVFY